nr:DUF2514 domain-containing protein [uncultured Comamonas sp.]
MSSRVVAAILLALGAVLGVQAWNTHLVAKGDAQGAQRVHSEWKAAEAKREGDAARLQAENERSERAKEQAKQKEAERIAREQVQREQAMRSAMAAADARNRSLHTTIAQLNADAAARMPSDGQAACSAADIDGATAARNALGQCSSRYTAVAGVADQLAGQVAGLQDYVRTVPQGGADGR